MPLLVLGTAKQKRIPAPCTSPGGSATPALLPRPEEARPPSYGSPGYGSQTGNVSAGGATDQTPVGVRAEDSTPSSEDVLSTMLMAPPFNMPGLRLPHLLLDNGSDGGPPHRASRLLARAPEDPLPSASALWGCTSPKKVALCSTLKNAVHVFNA